MENVTTPDAHATCRSMRPLIEYSIIQTSDRQNTHWPRPIPENLKSARLKSPDPDRWRSANRRVPHLSSLNSQTKRRSWKSAHLPLLTDRFRVSILCIFLKGFFFRAGARWRHLLTPSSGFMLALFFMPHGVLA